MTAQMTQTERITMPNPKFREILLCKYGEICLKGSNRSFFETLLSRELKYRLSQVGHYKVIKGRSLARIEPADDDADMDAAWNVAMRTFGIIAVSRSAYAEKNIDELRRTAVEYLSDTLLHAKTFKVEAKRADKSFPLHSQQICEELGAAILTNYHHLKVDVHHPEVTVLCEVREEGAYITAGQQHAAGGMPVGSNGKGMLLLSGGIDSPVAGWMMAKRGIKLEAVYFESFPYTSEQAREKVVELARKLTPWAGSIFLHVVSLTHIQEELSRACCEDYFTLLLRRYMMTIATRIARNSECGSLITGESLGQVASQTMQALAVTNAATDLPVFRPLIGMDKEEIIERARFIDTFETSILPYEDCCTVFTPRHPKTRPELSHVLEEEAKLDFAALVDEAVASDNVIYLKADFRD